jgi:hypothetical protein
MIGCILIPFFPYDMKETVVAISLMAGSIIMIAIYINIILNYVKSMFKKPGYLSLTLPVSTQQLLLSKVIGALLWSFVGTIVLVFGMALIISTLGEVTLQNVLLDINWSKVDYLALGLLLLSVITYMFVSITVLYFVITVTQTKYFPRGKTVVSVVLCTAFIMLLSSRGVTNLFNQFHEKIAVLLFSILSVIVGILLFFGTTYLIDHKIEVE